MEKIEIEHVQRTFRQVSLIEDQAAALFYGRLFELDPSLKKLFTSDIKIQGKKLMVALRTVVTGLNKLEKIVPIVRNLGAKHAGFGVQESHYATVGEALIWTLEKGLGDNFTPAVRDAWVSAYGLLSGVMIGAARDELQNGAAQASLSQAGEAS